MKAREFIIELKISDTDVKRIIKDRLAIHAETGVDAMKLAIDRMASIPKTSYVQSQASQLMMLYKQSKMKIGGDYYRKLNKLTEDKHPNEKPTGPETKPTMPKGLDTTDIDPKSHEKKKGQKTDKTYNVGENFADGKVKGKSRPGRVKRSGASCNGSVTDLRKRAKNASGEKAKMYHWCANMKSGRNK
jgi:hypothetical protein